MSASEPRRSSRQRKAVQRLAQDQTEAPNVTTKSTILARKAAATESAPKPKRQKKQEDVDVPLTTQSSGPRKKPKTRERGTEDCNETLEHPQLLAPKHVPASSSSDQPKSSKSQDYNWLEDAATLRNQRQMARIPRLVEGQKEKRLRPYIHEPNEKFHAYLWNACNHRMFVLKRERGVEDRCHANNRDCPYEAVTVAGSKGNVYTVMISHLMFCTCPVGVFKRRNQQQSCKHVLYVLRNVLKAPDHLVQQNAFLTSELRQLFDNSPLLSAELAPEVSSQDDKRKPIEGDCPICYMEFEQGEDITWCRAACGNNFHSKCFDQWEANRLAGVTCPLCRSAWECEGRPPYLSAQMANVANVEIPSDRGTGGYRNVAHLLDYESASR